MFTKLISIMKVVISKRVPNGSSLITIRRARVCRNTKSYLEFFAYKKKDTEMIKLPSYAKYQSFNYF